jgi:SPP1 family predicted phage head-tail adaptor
MATPNPEIAAGSLDRYVALLRPTYSDEFQDEISNYDVVTHVFASITPMQAYEHTEANRTVAVTQTAIVIRHRDDIDARWRVQENATVWEIDGFLNRNQRRAQLYMICREVE